MSLLQARLGDWTQGSRVVFLDGFSLSKRFFDLGMVAYACSPVTGETEAGRSLEPRILGPAWAVLSVRTYL
jgi:hypothetical protein